MSDSEYLKNKIAVASDHGGVDLKNILVHELVGKGYEVMDLGVTCGITADYPDQAKLVVDKILKNEAGKGILLCGSGNGITMAANRYPGIRAALCHDEYTARMSRLHNDANILVIGGRVIGPDVAKCMLHVWLQTEFEGGRHLPRIEKIDSVAAEYLKRK